MEIIIKVKAKDDYIENEIRKNNLLFERRDIFELKVGDQLIYYFSSKWKDFSKFYDCLLFL